MKCNGKLFTASIFVILLSSAVLFAQKTESFDIITYQKPKDWQKNPIKDAVQLSFENKDGGLCLINIVRSLPGGNDPKANFEVSWGTMVKDIFTLIGERQTQSSPAKNGWTAESGFSAYDLEGEKGVALLVTLSGGNKMVNILILTNSDAFEKNIDDFLNSIILPKAEIVTAQSTNQTAPPASLTQNIWKSTQNRKDSLGNYAGYSTGTYQFYDNGTYRFSNVTFQSFAPKFYMTDEEGTYQITGNKLTVTPAKSYYRIHEREKSDPPSKSGNLNLESARYVFEFTSINDRLRLILAPADGSETKRDGPFNFYANGAMTRSYIYDADGIK